MPLLTFRSLLVDSNTPAMFLHYITPTLVRTTSMKQSSLAQDGAILTPSIQRLIPSSDGGDNEHG
jgi:hypothetical protein